MVYFVFCPTGFIVIRQSQFCPKTTYTWHFGAFQTIVSPMISPFCTLIYPLFQYFDFFFLQRRALFGHFVFVAFGKQNTPHHFALVGIARYHRRLARFGGFVHIFFKQKTDASCFFHTAMASHTMLIQDGFHFVIEVHLVAKNP